MLKSRILGIVVSVAMLLSVSSKSFAGFVSYYTEGAFNANALASTDSLSFGGALGGTLTLTYTGVSVTNFATPPDGISIAPFGDFTLASTGNPDFAAINGNLFTLAVYQVSPVPTLGSPGVLAGAFSGTVIWNGGPGGTGTVNFVPSNFVVTAAGGNTSYQILNPSNVPGGVSGFIAGGASGPTGVPLPPSAWAGSALFAGLGGVRLIRRMLFA